MATETQTHLPQPTDPDREPIINSPYGPPEWRWQLDTSTKAYQQSTGTSLVNSVETHGGSYWTPDNCPMETSWTSPEHGRHEKAGP